MEISPLNRPCRACAGCNLSLILSLGRTPLANALLSREALDQPEPRYPLDVAFCPDCALVQITESIPPEQLFRDYVYFSSFSDSFLAHARTLVQRVLRERRLGAASQVIEIASNDGYLLQYYKERGVPVLGVEPATNIARVAQEQRGIPTLNDFFGEALARQLHDQEKQADVIHANNVMAHVPDLNGFVKGLRLLLKNDGIAIIEVPYVKDLIEHCEFDTIYHEHLFYFSLTSLDRLFRRHELRVADVERVALHGGSLQLWVARAENAGAPSAAVADLLRLEQDWGVDRREHYQSFARRVEQRADELRSLLINLKRQGKRLAAYGASAKGSTLLNYLDLPAGTLDYVVDRSTVKQGRYTPGTHLPIFTDKLLQDRPDYALLLTWNFVAEILQQQEAYRRQGGRFIIPLPDIKVV